MRIIGGEMGGRVLQPPMKKWPTRPTTDIAKEALYNILNNRIDFEEETMLDLYGGTGAHVFEFLSRGCRDVTYVDKYGPCVSWVKAQVKSMELDAFANIIKRDVTSYIKNADRSFSFIFADPPYALPILKQLPDLILNAHLLSEDGMMVIEHGSDLSLEAHAQCYEVRKYGQSRFSFFKTKV